MSDSASSSNRAKAATDNRQADKSVTGKRRTTNPAANKRQAVTLSAGTSSASTSSASTPDFSNSIPTKGSPARPGFQQLWPVLKRLLAYGLAWRKPLTLGLLLLWIAAAAEVSGPVMVSYFIDHFVAQQYLPVRLLCGFAAAYIALQLLAVLLRYFQVLLFNQAALGVVQKLRTEVMQAALNQPLSVFDSQPVGQLISRVTNDTEVIRDLYVTVMVAVLRGLTLIIAMMIAMLMLNWHMALLALIMFPAAFTVMFLYQRYSTPIARRVRGYLGDINDGFNEIISGMTVIQQFRQQTRFARQLLASSEAHYQARMQTLRLDGVLLRPLLSLLSALILCGLLLLFGFTTLGGIEVGVLYAFVSYLGRLNEPLIQLTTQQSMLQQAMVAGERVFELIDSPRQRYGDDHRPLTSGTIAMRQLNFAYRDQHRVLQDININVPSRHFLALVGHTGSGKSTLVNLLMGYYPPQSGTVLLDGRPLNRLSHQVLRQGVAMVQQDPVVLADSFYANVALGRDISEQQVWQALEKVQLDSLARRLPAGIHTRLGEQGNTLSVGQKQLLALARVLVQVPQILILDEATANIDSGTEQAIARALAVIRRHTTLVVIAHRLSTIVEADSILVLHRGQIVEQGTHSELLAAEGRYWQMYQLQLAGEELHPPETALSVSA